ncbi:MAG TPA: hypothetical protein VHI13_05215 [Candidatus Kapabacteria bacterium]|nr:hypothetical protein [Candidatus Kapabacteria bacterium]
MRIETNSIHQWMPIVLDGPTSIDALNEKFEEGWRIEGLEDAERHSHTVFHLNAEALDALHASLKGRAPAGSPQDGGNSADRMHATPGAWLVLLSRRSAAADQVALRVTRNADGYADMQTFALVMHEQFIGWTCPIWIAVTRELMVAILQRGGAAADTGAAGR